MGMLQAKCPRCKKKRRKAEDYNTAENKRWVCFVCAKEVHAILQGKPDADR